MKIQGTTNTHEGTNAKKHSSHQIFFPSEELEDLSPLLVFALTGQGTDLQCPTLFPTTIAVSLP